VLTGTGPDGTSNAAARLLQSLAALAREHDLPTVSVGATTVKDADESVTDVLTRAEEDARRRTGGGQDE
jgi:hypothetical protein